MRLLLVLTSILFLGLGSPLRAQPSTSTKDAWQMVPADGVALVTLQVKSIIQDESMRMMPWEVLSQISLQQFGIDATKLERIDLVACAPGVALRVGALVTFQEDIPANGLEPFEQEDTQANKGVELYAIPNTPDVVIHKKDSRHLLIGTKPFVMAAVKVKAGDGPLRAMATGLGEPGPISIVMAFEPVREVLASFVQSPPLPGGLVKDVESLVTKTDMLAVRINVGSTNSMATLIQTKSPADATEVNAAVGRLVKQGTQAMIASVKQQASEVEGTLPAATLSYLQRLAPEIEKSSSFKVNGNRMIMTLDGTQMTAGQMGVAVGLLLPAVQSARTAARRMQSSNNLKQMALAFHNFESTYKQFPMDKDIALDQKAQGKMEPNLSWRVHILPYIEQVQLYKEFHLDEPWDSPHNIKLLDKMPEIYRQPRAKVKPGYTVYQQPTGPGLIQTPGMPGRFRNVTDGTSNTMLYFESTDEAAVPWTKPGDANPMENLKIFRSDDGFFQAALVDGSVRTFSTATDVTVLKALLTRAGGEVVRF